MLNLTHTLSPSLKLHPSYPSTSYLIFLSSNFFITISQLNCQSHFENMWRRNAERILGNQAVLRNANEFFIQNSRLASTDLFPLSNYPRMWRNFPDQSIKNLYSKSLFKSNLKLYFLNNLSSTVVCNRLLCPNCNMPAL